MRSARRRLQDAPRVVSSNDNRRRLIPKGALLAMKIPVPGGTLTVTLGTRHGTGGPFDWAVEVKQPRGYVHFEPDLTAGSAE